MTVVTSKKRRLTIMECPNDMNAMCDASKVADLVVLIVDGSFGFQMETFEFLNLCQVHSAAPEKPLLRNHALGIRARPGQSVGAGWKHQCGASKHAV